jgi:DNA invertase Pin-like site-specific DNA recombinase
MRRLHNRSELQIGPFNVSSAVGYLRVSTEEQANEGVSLAVQEERIRAYCVGAGLVLVHLVREEGVSGTKALTDRPAGSQLQALLAPHCARHVVALKLDRLFRDAADALNQTRKWDHAGVALHLIDMGGQALSTASAMGRMMMTMMAAFAELERNLIAERTTTALRHKKAHGNVYARIPLGYQRVGDDLVEDRAELAVVLHIQDLRTLGQNYTQIAAELTRAQIPTKRGGRWHASTVRYLLRNNLYDDISRRAP